MSIPLRITHGMMNDRLMGDLRRADQSLNKTSNQISSTRRLDTAADDPVGAHQALRWRAELSQVDTHRAGTAAADGWMTVTDTALGSIGDVLQRVRELVVQASNDTYTAIDRAKFAGEISLLLEHTKATGNAQFGDQYVFSGQASTTAPYAAGASDAYAGDTSAVTRTIGPGQSVQINVTGDNILGGTAGDGLVLDTLRTAIANLNGGTPADVANLRTGILQRLNANLDTVLTARSTIGATQNRVTLADSRLADIQLAVTSQLSMVEDTDMPAALSQLSSQQTAYQAALHAGANVMQRSLMDFLS